MEIFEEEIRLACDILEKGGIILYPTDTIWGIGCDATNDNAVKKVFDIKRRADSKALIVMIDNPVKIDFYADSVPEITRELIEVSDKPLTIVYPRGRNLSSLLLAEDGSVGIRVTEEVFSKKLCGRFRKAIVSTSANISGETAPKNFSEISEEIKNSVDYIVKYRQDDISQPNASSVIKVEDGGVIKILRA
ncbi:MAG: L-threonylcarbamoyladenylate synthase [Bacteroidales bacterium]